MKSFGLSGFPFSPGFLEPLFQHRYLYISLCFLVTVNKHTKPKLCPVFLTCVQTPNSKLDHREPMRVTQQFWEFCGQPPVGHSVLNVGSPQSAHAMCCPTEAQMCPTFQANTGLHSGSTVSYVGKWTVSYIAPYVSTRSTLYNLPHSPIHTFSFAFCTEVLSI